MVITCFSKGRGAGLRIVANIEQQEYMAGIYQSAGLQVAILDSHQSRTWIEEIGFSVDHGSEVDISVSVQHVMFLFFSNSERLDIYC